MGRHRESMTTCCIPWFNTHVKPRATHRRSDLQQVEYQTQEVSKVTDRHRQTLIGEEQHNQGEQTEADNL
eukprot:9566885-Heterocapsa_arctica.AAC.1